MPGAARVARVSSPAPARALDVVVFGATGFVGRLVARAPGGQRADRRCGSASPGGRADRLAAVRDRPRSHRGGVAAAHGGRRRPGLAGADGRGHPRRRHDRRPLRPVRRAAGRGLRRRRHPLRRPDRRGAVHARADRRAATHRRAHRRADRPPPAASTRSPPTSVSSSPRAGRADGRRALEDTTLAVTGDARRRQRRHGRLAAAQLEAAAATRRCAGCSPTPTR